MQKVVIDGMWGCRRDRRRYPTALIRYIPRYAKWKHITRKKHTKKQQETKTKPSSKAQSFPEASVYVKGTVKEAFSLCKGRSTFLSNTNMGRLLVGEL